MVLALHWVQDNIGVFGGDPDQVLWWQHCNTRSTICCQVTIFGESAGSWACSYLLVSPLAQVEGHTEHHGVLSSCCPTQGLFHRAILQSGAWTHPGWRLLSREEGARVRAGILMGSPDSISIPVPRWASTGPPVSTARVRR